MEKYYDKMIKAQKNGKEIEFFVFIDGRIGLRVKDDTLNIITIFDSYAFCKNKLNL